MYKLCISAAQDLILGESRDLQGENIFSVENFVVFVEKVERCSLINMQAT